MDQFFIGSSISDYFVYFQMFRRLVKLFERWILKKAKICCRKRGRRLKYSEQCIPEHSVVFSFIKGRTWLNYFETFLCLFCTRSRWPFALKMKLWHHYTEILFLRLWESFFPKINKFLDGIRDTVVWFTDCVVLLYKIPPIGRIKF